MCFTRYQRSLNSRMMKSKWTPEEDHLLAEATKIFGQRNWQQVAHCIPGRTGQQCLHRWQKTLDPDIVHGKWSHEHDKV
jgi:hypothetical protein